MSDKQRLNDNKEAMAVPNKNFEFEDYERSSQLSKGLAETHEQVSDDYYEGTIDAVIENVDGQNVKIPNKGYENMFNRKQ